MQDAVIAIDQAKGRGKNRAVAGVLQCFPWLSSWCMGPAYLECMVGRQWLMEEHWRIPAAMRQCVERWWWVLWEWVGVPAEVLGAICECLLWCRELHPAMSLL